MHLILYLCGNTAYYCIYSSSKTRLKKKHSNWCNLILDLIKSQRIYIMYRGNQFQQADSLQRDALISMLKKELSSLHEKQHEFLTLQESINNADANYLMIQDERERIENEHRMKLDINRKNIAELRSEIDSVKMQNHKCAVQIEDIIRDIHGIRRMCDNREAELQTQISKNQELDGKNQKIAEENKTLLIKIKGSKDERNRADQEHQRLQRTLDDNINVLKNLEKDARRLESENSKLQSVLIVAEKDYSNLMEEAKTKEELVFNSNKKLENLNKEIEELKDKTSRLQKQCLKNEQQYRNTSQVLQVTTGRNRDQAKKLKQLEGRLRQIENELDRAILERDGLENEHDGLSSEHNILNSEIDNILLQIIEYEKVNKELLREIENYISYDEQARSMLNRKQAMRNLLETVSARLTVTGDHIAHLRS